jgi:Arylsulfotransferase (ASST)
MKKLVPVWLLLLCLLLGAVFTVIFGWSVKTGRPARLGLGNAAVAIASFPDMVQRTFKQIRSDPDSKVRVPRTSADLTGFRPIKVRSGIDLQGLMIRADQAAVARASGWRILVGAFTIDGELKHAALALSPELEVVHVWMLEQDIQGKKTPSGRLFPHGFAMLNDGSVIYSFDVGSSLQRIDRCGKKIWAVGGPFGHAVSLGDDGRFAWVLRDYMDGVLGDVNQVATATGEIVRHITMDEIIAANPSVDILEIRRKDNNWVTGNPRRTRDDWLDDPFHTNDVEPLPATIAKRFEGFEAGDLLISARSLNLVFVLDPDTLEIKWWQTGPWRRQHDADWQPNGEITVYDNRMNRDYSRIVSIEPASKSARVVFDGRVNDFYSRIRGKHQITSAGNLLITSPQQGRIFELDPNGQVVFEVYNTKPGTDKVNYPLSEAIWFPADAFDFAKDFTCGK